MAQSAITVTPPNPTPPTNMSFTGTTAPNPPNYTKNTYNDIKNYGSGTVASPPTYPPPYYDDGAAGTVTLFAANTAALASGSAATAGGTEGTYPGTGTDPDDITSVQDVGAVPVSTSVAHEGAGTEVVVTAPGSVATAPTASFSCLGAYTNTPNASHASYLGGSAVPTTSACSAGGVSGAGTTLLTVTGTNFNRSSVVYVDGIAQTTNYVSATSLTVTNAPKKATAGNRSVTVVNGVGGVPSNATNWVFS